MPGSRRGLVAPQNTFLESIIRKCSGAREYYLFYFIDSRRTNMRARARGESEPRTLYGNESEERVSPVRREPLTTSDTPTCPQIIQRDTLH